MEQDNAKAPFVEVDISKWTFGDRLEFQRLAGESEAAVLDFLLEHKVVTAWSFAGDPAEREAWLKLPLEAVGMALAEVADAGNARFLAGRTGRVSR